MDPLSVHVIDGADVFDDVAMTVKIVTVRGRLFLCLVLETGVCDSYRRIFSSAWANSFVPRRSVPFQCTAYESRAAQTQKGLSGPFGFDQIATGSGPFA